MFAIVQIAGKQYKVSIGTKLVVDRLDGKVGDALKFDRVLLLSDDKKTKMGNPIVKGVVVSAKVVAQKAGEKIHIRRFASKVRHRRHVGFRPQETELEITAITAK